MAMIQKRTMLTGSFLLAAVSVVFTWFFYQYTLDIEGVVERTDEAASVDPSAAGKPVVHLSVISRYPPNVISSGYQPMLDYMTRVTPYRFELKLCADYNQALDMLLKKEVAAAFLGSYLYIKAREEHGVIPILKPLNSDFEPFSRSVLFTSSAKEIFNIRDLRGKKLALPSKESYSSHWLLKYEFQRNGIRAADLAEIVNFPHHQSVLQQVSSGAFDAGVIREQLINRAQSRKLRVLMYSDPFPTSPIVVAPGYSPEIVAAIREALLSIGRDGTRLEQITHGWDNEFIYGFVEAKDSDYDPVRAITSR